MKTRNLIALTAILATLALGLGATACHRGFGHGPMDPERIDKFVTFHLDDFLEELDASDGQKRQIFTVKDDMLKQVLAQREGHLADRLILLQEFGADRPDRDRLHALLDRRLDGMKVLAHQGLDSLLDVHAILTPQQRALIKNKVAARHGCALQSN